LINRLCRVVCVRLCITSVAKETVNVVYNNHYNK